MNIHLKTAAILLATLIIGMLCGALILGAFARDQLQPPPQMTRERFVELWLKIVIPDGDQRPRIREVVERHETRLRENYTRHRREMKALVDSLHRDLDPLLTESQRERVSRFRKRYERRREFRRDGDHEPRRERGRPGEGNRGSRQDNDLGEERGRGGDL